MSLCNDMKLLIFVITDSLCGHGLGIHLLQIQIPAYTPYAPSSLLSHYEEHLYETLLEKS
jgi:hypothetical protein